MKNRFAIIIVLFIVIEQLTSCKKDFEKINTNPNNLTEAPYTNVLAGAQIRLAQTVEDGLGFGLASLWAQQLARNNYFEGDRYAPRDPSSAWSLMYRTAANLNNLDISSSAETPKRKAVAKILKAYTFQIITDLWGDVPYSEAFKGKEENYTPKYDSPRSIYLSLIKELKEASTLLENDPGTSTVDILGSGDMIYAGNGSKWRKFSNSLLLRVYIRLSGSSSAADQKIAKEGIEEILSNTSKFPIFTSRADEAKFNYFLTSTAERNPAYNSHRSNPCTVASKLLTTTLKNRNDPRLNIYADSAKNTSLTDRFQGLQNGANSIPVKNNIPAIGVKFIGSGTIPTVLLSYSEVLFIIAEAANNGWNAGTYTAKQAYDAAITENMSKNGVTTAAINTYLNHSLVDLNAVSDKPQAIAEQKWLALYMQGTEAWSEARRTGFPVLIEAPASPYTGLGTPTRFPYPANEEATNSGNLSVVQSGIQSKMFVKKLFWAK